MSTMHRNEELSAEAGQTTPAGDGVDLRVFCRAEVMAMLAEFARRHRPRDVKRESIVTQLGLLKVRDAQGVYWSVDPYLPRWYVHSGSGWVAASEPDWPVEALTQAMMYLSEPTDVAPAVEAQLAPTEPDRSSGATTRTMERIVAGTYNDYRNGRLTLLMTQELLRQYVVVDKSASLWAVGCHSGQWYRFADAQWASAPSPPADGDLPAPEEMDGLRDPLALAFLRLIASDASFPCEAVSDEWHPPGGVPPLSIWADRCAACGAVLAPAQRFCTQCGAKRAAPAPVCAKCGASVQPGQRFCTHCGTRVAPAQT
jgi:hypothetical protein